MCVAESDFGKRLPYAFLTEVCLCYNYNDCFIQFEMIPLLRIFYCVHHDLVIGITNMQVNKAFSTGSLTYRAPTASDGELNTDFRPVLARNMV